MTVTCLFVAVFTASKVKTTPANAPTIDIADLAAPTGSLLVSAGTPTQLTHLTGYYVYAYTTSTLTTKPVANFHTDDTSVDQQDLGSYPQVLIDANGNVLADVQTNADKTGYALTAGEHTNMATDTQTGLTAQGYTPTRAGYLDKLNSFLDAPVSGVSTALTTLLARLGAFSGSGVNTVLGFLQAALRKDATLPSDVGGTFTPTTDSQEAFREKTDTLAPGTPQVVQLAATITEDHTS